MGTWLRSNATLVLVIGDALMLGVVTLVGFASHGTLLEAGSRMLTTFIPLAFSWFLISPFLGVYGDYSRSDYHQLWRVLLAGTYASPLAAWLRGVLLNTPILPVFVLVLGAVSILGLVIWRVVFILMYKRKPE
jgi:hypothetical protein